MATSSAHPFSTPDSPGDAPIVFVLIEGSGVMLGCWNDIRNHFLPKLLDALRASHPETMVSTLFIHIPDVDVQNVYPSFSTATYFFASFHRPV